MGCDIHTVFQAKKAGVWQDIENRWDEPRAYTLFTWLAGVRDNGSITPISAPRGFPHDFVVQDDGEGYDIHPVSCVTAIAQFKRNWIKDGDALHVWMGDHSFSWLTADEILAATTGTTVESGVIGIEAYRRWDGSQPQMYSQGVYGNGVVIERAGRRRGIPYPDFVTHVWVEWEMPLHARFRGFLEMMRGYKEDFGEVRIVFGFDS